MNGETGPPTATDATTLLRSALDGRPRSMDALFEVVYADLRRVAGALMRGEGTDHTLQPTALVHEAYVRLIREEGRSVRGKAHFLAVAARAMRQVLVDHARGKRRLKRGGDAVRAPLDEQVLPAVEGGPDLLALDEALERLRAKDEHLVRLVELKVFLGLTMDEIAAQQGRPKRSVERQWTLARAWLAAELSDAGDSPRPSPS